MTCACHNFLDIDEHEALHSACDSGDSSGLHNLRYVLTIHVLQHVLIWGQLVPTRQVTCLAHNGPAARQVICRCELDGSFLQESKTVTHAAAPACDRLAWFRKSLDAGKAERPPLCYPLDVRVCVHFTNRSLDTMWSSPLRHAVLNAWCCCSASSRVSTAAIQTTILEAGATQTSVSVGDLTPRDPPEVPRELTRNERLVGWAYLKAWNFFPLASQFVLDVHVCARCSDFYS